MPASPNDRKERKMDGATLAVTLALRARSSEVTAPASDRAGMPILEPRR